MVCASPAVEEAAYHPLMARAVIARCCTPSDGPCGDRSLAAVCSHRLDRRPEFVAAFDKHPEELMKVGRAPALHLMLNQHKELKAALDKKQEVRAPPHPDPTPEPVPRAREREREGERYDPMPRHTYTRIYMLTWPACSRVRVAI